MNIYLTSGGIALLLSVILTPLFIPLLKRLKFGQSIREEGPSWHQKKSGTPTMGGIAIILSVLLGGLGTHLFLNRLGTTELALYIGALLFGIIGFVDDYIKVVKKRNLGLTSAQKFLAQLAFSVAIVIFMSETGNLGGELFIPFAKMTVNIGLWMIPLSVLVLLAVVNSVNLTDGIDGLATSVTMVVSVFFLCCALRLENTPVAVFMGVVLMSCLGFLFFNANPAKVFMGDTGSLFLGATIGIGAICLKMPLVLIIAGGVYLMETLSVILQVASFKLTGKRIFKMSPIHHHFEMCGMNEKQIVLLFSLISAVLCVISYLAIF